MAKLIESAKILFGKVFENWAEHNVPRLAAAFSFFAVLSLAPTLVFIIAVAGAYFGQGATLENIVAQAQGSLGKEGADLVRQLASQSRDGNASTLATVLSLIITFFGASNLFVQLNEAVNHIWGIKLSGHFIKTLFTQRIAAFLSVLLFGGVLVSWLVFDSYLQKMATITDAYAQLPIVSFIGSVLFLTVAFGVTYKVLPRRMLAWSDVWLGAFIAALGAAISKYLLALYFGLAGFSQIYGGAGALVVILLWINYSTQIYFFGTEIVYAYTHLYGSRKPKPPVTAPSDV